MLMLTPTQTFRLLVLGYLLSGIAAGGVDFVFPHLVPAAASQAIDAEAQLKMLEHWPSLAILIVSLVAHIVGAIGLLFFRRWARSLSLWTTGVGFFLYPLVGATVSSGWANALNELSVTLWGAVLALSYFGPLCARFGKAQDHHMSIDADPQNNGG